MAEIVADQGVPLPGMPPNLAPESRGPAWQPAFIAYCRGFPLEQISGVYGISLGQLQKRAEEEHWAALAAEMPAAKANRPKDVAAADLARIQENRSNNYRALARLRGIIEKKIELMERGELKIHRVLSQPKSLQGYVDAYQDPGPSDLVSIATALKTVAEGTYRALGDVIQGEGTSGQSQSKVPGVTVLLPGVVSRPREANGDGAKMAEARVVDLAS